MIAIIKPVGSFCNIRCSYCFYNHTDQSNAGTMNYSLLEKLTREYIEFSTGNKLFIWHGGEPTLAGIEFYEKAIVLQAKYKDGEHSIKNAIQTNATTITDEWVRFFRENDFSVGVSIDGCKENHGLFRKDKRGKNTFDRTMKGIQKLRDGGISVGFIQTLTSSRIPFLKNDFQFFYDNLETRKWAMGTFLDNDHSNCTMSSESISREELDCAMKTTIDLWLEKDDRKLMIREVENILFGVIGKRPSNCHYNGTCGQYFCIERDGRIYPCDRFSSQDQHFWGDLNKESLSEIWQGSKRIQYLRDVRQITDKCSSCSWLPVCNNGCPSHRIGGIRGQYYYCETRKELFEYLQAKIKPHISKIHAERR